MEREARSLYDVIKEPLGIVYDLFAVMILN